MIDEKLLIERMWDKYNSFYNVALRFEKEETKMANRVLGDIQRMIEEQPKINEWTPVEERLPEEEGTYLCYEVCGNYPNYGVLNFAKNLHKVDKYDFRNEKRPGFYHLDSEYGYIEDTNVVAWMPLPSPYDMRKKVEE